jgi:5-methyltetrahydrofolate--homocysteine methyltransferase
LDRIRAEKLLRLRGVAGIFPAAAEGDDIVLQDSGRRFCFLRSQEKKRPGAFNPCLADFILPRENGAGALDWIGLFALSAGFGVDEQVRRFQAGGNEYGALLLSTLANALTEAFVEEVHLRVRREWWAYAAHETSGADEVIKGTYQGIRPAFGYPASPDHGDKRIAFDILEARERCGFELTGSAMMIPAASVCGMFFASPASCYFGIGAAGGDQLTDWAKRKGISEDEARQRLSSVLAAVSDSKSCVSA